MKNKKRDVLFCGVDPWKIRTAKPVLNNRNLKYLHRFITKRYRIHKRKDVQKLTAPWTNDPILLDFKFTNVRREHDRETLWLIREVTSNPGFSYENKLMNCILYRMFNKSQTIDIFGGIDFDGLDKKYVQDSIRSLLHQKLEEDPKYTFFTNAFLTCGLKVALGNQKATNDEFMPMRVIKFACYLYEDGIVDKIKAAKNQKEVFDVIKSYNGLGEFLSYQIFVDFTYIKEFPFSENEFTVSGPGCARGLRNIFDDFDGMTDAEAIFWMRDNLGREFLERGWKWNPMELFDDLPEHDRCLNVMSLENCMCEISKYIRAANGTGRPKNKYKGRG